MFLVVVVGCAASTFILWHRLDQQLQQSRLGPRFTYCDGVRLASMTLKTRADPTCNRTPATLFQTYLRFHRKGS